MIKWEKGKKYGGMGEECRRGMDEGIKESRLGRKEGVKGRK
jgi:hypothetical protein